MEISWALSCEESNARNRRDIVDFNNYKRAFPEPNENNDSCLNCFAGAFEESAGFHWRLIFYSRFIFKMSICHVTL